jgi:hypothetical protein
LAEEVRWGWVVSAAARESGWIFQGIAPASDGGKKVPERRSFRDQEPHRLAVVRAIPWSGCVPAEPASVSPGRTQ